MQRLKKFLITAVLMVTLSGGLAAQHWCPPGAHWRYNYDNGSGIRGHVEIFYADDTLILGKPAIKLIRAMHAYNYNTGNPVCLFQGTDYTIEDSGVVYIWYNNQWDTLYNFNAQVGDSWRMAKQPLVNGACDSNSTLKVIATGTTTINAVNLRYKVVEFQYGGTILTGITDTIIEKIGFAGSYMFPYDRCHAALDTNEGGPFRCYSDQNFPEYKPYFPLPCSTVGMEEDRSESRFVIVPNPVTNSFSIPGINPIMSDSYVITDVSGKVVQSGILTSTTDVSSLKSGLYLLHIRKADATLITRFIKQ